jgi:NAD(P)-dependent dehydrogenase (short-subunit alcohol dehydrogenase family)
MNELLGKTAVITGGGNGIGEAVCRLFADEGARMIVVGDINEQKGEALAAQISQTGCSCRFVKTDVSDSAQIKRLFDAAKSHCGRLDILVNCAGVCHVTPLKDAAGEDWDMQININQKGTFLCCREALRMMEPNRYGKIVNVSSISGRVGGIRTSAGYVASKGAVISLTRSLAKNAAAHNINVNCVAPGVIDTDMTRSQEYHPNEIPMGRKGTAKEVAEVVAFLASDRASYLAGTTIDINGGSYMG